MACWSSSQAAKIFAGARFAPARSCGLNSITSQRLIRSGLGRDDQQSLIPEAEQAGAVGKDVGIHAAGGVERLARLRCRDAVFPRPEPATPRLSKRRKINRMINKSRARLASPQPRPTSPVNGAGGKTGCQDDAQATAFVPGTQYFFPHG